MQCIALYILINSLLFSVVSSYLSLRFNSGDRVIHVRITETERWLSVCNQSLMYFNDRLQRLYVSTVIAREVKRMDLPVYKSFGVKFRGSNHSILNFVVKEGDDTGQVVHSTMKSLNLTSAEGIELAHALSKHVSADIIGNPKWVKWRRYTGGLWYLWSQTSSNPSRDFYSVLPSCGSNLFPPRYKAPMKPTPSIPFESSSASSFIEEASITIAVTTCRRPVLFAASLRALRESLGGKLTTLSWRDGGVDILQVLVVDDSSSPSDRESMLELLPESVFVCRGTGRGHAKSLNTILRMVSTRYLFYLEDDWRAISTPILSRSLSTSVGLYSSEQHVPLLHSLLRGALEVLRDSRFCERKVENDSSCTELIAQVHMNEIITHDCSYKVWDGSDSTQSCEILSEVGRSGWPRTARAFSNNGTMVDIPYGLHEFGLTPYTSYVYGGRNHEYSFWPGFSLNPAVWDLTLLTDLLDRCMEDSNVQSNLYPGSYSMALFDETDIEFEHKFTALVYASGANIAYLPAYVFEHIGFQTSAYAESGQQRTWDYYS